MTIFNSSIHNFAIARVQDNGSPGAWQYFPCLPSDYVPVESIEPHIRIDGTAQVPIFWDITLTFQMKLSADMSKLSQLYDPNHQEIYLNYPVPTSLSGNSNNFWVGKGYAWRYSRGVFRKPPRWGKAGNINFYQCTMEFNNVEWNPVYK